jgi:hypothetical protein
MYDYPTPGETVTILPTLLSTHAGQRGVVTTVDADRDTVYVAVAGIEHPFVSREVARDER